MLVYIYFVLAVDQRAVMSTLKSKSEDDLESISSPTSAAVSRATSLVADESVHAVIDLTPETRSIVYGLQTTAVQVK